VVRWLAGVLFIAGVAVAVVAFFAVEVCDGQLTGSGDVVDVCRHMQITDPPVIAVGIVVLASLGAFFTEVSGLGISLKRDVKDAKDVSSTARRVASDAAAASRSAEQAVVVV